MELRHLRYFVTVAEELNITRAAMRLNVSQPPLSRQIRDLEDEIGVLLLERSPKAVRLTAAGRVFFKEARRVLQLAEQAVKKVQSVPDTKAGEILVGYSPSPTVEILPRALRAFRKLAPKARAVLLDLSSDDMIDRLKAKTLDIALLVKPPLKKGGRVIFERLNEMPVGIIVPPRHPFAKRQSVSLDEALSQLLVAYIRKGYADYHHWLASVVKHSGRKPKLATQVDGAPSLVAAVESGQGVAFGPPTFTMIGAGRVKFVPLHPLAPPLQVGYAVRKDTPSNVLSSFIEALKLSVNP